MAKDKHETLADEPVMAVDDRPRTMPVQVPGGPARIIRMQAEQLFAQLAHFKAAGIDPSTIQVTEATREQLARFVQRCVIETDTAKLMFPGANGLRLLSFWPDDRLLSVAVECAKFQEL